MSNFGSGIMKILKIHVIPRKYKGIGKLLQRYSNKVSASDSTKQSKCHECSSQTNSDKLKNQG